MADVCPEDLLTGPQCDSRSVQVLDGSDLIRRAAGLWYLPAALTLLIHGSDASQMSLADWLAEPTAGQQQRPGKEVRKREEAKLPAKPGRLHRRSFSFLFFFFRQEGKWNTNDNMNPERIEGWWNLPRKKKKNPKHCSEQNLFSQKQCFGIVIRLGCYRTDKHTCK